MPILMSESVAERRGDGVASAAAGSGGAARATCEQRVEIDLPRDRRADFGDPARGVAGFVAGHEAQMTLDDRETRIVMDGAQHRNVGVMLDHEPQLRLVPAAAQIVEDHAGDTYLAIERLVAEDQRCDAAGHPARVDDEHDRQAEHPCHCRVAVAAVEREAVVESLVALDQRDVGAGAVAAERRHGSPLRRKDRDRGCGMPARQPRRATSDR